MEGGGDHEGHTRRNNDDLAPVVWMAFMPRRSASLLKKLFQVVVRGSAGVKFFLSHF